MANKYDLVLLDLDGTVADTDELILTTMNILFDKYRNGQRTPAEVVYYYSGPPIRGSLAHEFPDRDPDEMVKEFAVISWDLYDTCVDVFPHVRETLISLKNRGIKLGIVTTKAHNSTIKCLTSLKIIELIPDFVAKEDVTNGKPDPEGIFKMMEHFAVKDKKKVLYVGDNKGDYLAARNAGVDSGMVTWGPRKIDRTLTPEYWIDDFADLEGIVNE